MMARSCDAYLKIGDEGELNEDSQDENFCDLSSASGLVPPLLHSHCAVRLENDFSGKGLPPRLLRESFALKRKNEKLRHGAVFPRRWHDLRVSSAEVRLACGWRLIGRAEQLCLQPQCFIEMHF